MFSWFWSSSQCIPPKPESTQPSPLQCPVIIDDKPVIGVLPEGHVASVKTNKKVCLSLSNLVREGRDQLHQIVTNHPQIPESTKPIINAGVTVGSEIAVEGYRLLNPSGVVCPDQQGIMLEQGNPHTAKQEAQYYQCELQKQSEGNKK